MKTFAAALLSTLLGVCAGPSAPAQGFINLDFESANLPSIPPGQFGGPVASSNALPGWSAFLGTNQVTQVLQNNLTLGNASIDILGPNWSLGGLIEGQYTVVLQPGRGQFGNDVSASIAQTGLVPANARSVQFKAMAFSDFILTLGGEELTLFALETTPNYARFGAAIPLPMVGQNQILEISVSAGPNVPNYFDSFLFSIEPIPEPDTLALGALGVTCLHLLRRRNRRT